MRRIDLAYFECKGCGHKCTPPESINAIPHQMEILEVLPAKELPSEQAKLAQLRAKHQGNTFTIETRGTEKIIKVARSYAKLTHTGKSLEETDFIKLDCPQCGHNHYTVSWKKRRRDMVQK